MSADWAAEVLHFWTDELGPDKWWTRSDETDQAIRERFGALWEARRSDPPEAFLGTANLALASAILFDQFPRNMFRHEPRAFATDDLALGIARGAIERDFDKNLEQDLRAWLYLPFMHSETVSDQDRSLALFTALGDANSLRFAREHHAIVARFGRFPHRNAALGREDRPGEEEAVKQGKDW